MNRSAPARLAVLAALLAAGSPALAHPHVWVKAKAEIVYDSNGKVTGVGHAWTFDPAYSAYSVQGLDKNNDGKLTPDELQELATLNTESLAEFGYFTTLKANGAKQEFESPRDYSMAFDNGQITLKFQLPLKTPAQGNRAVSLEVYDPSYFVSFELTEGDDPVRLAGAPQGCAVTLTRPKAPDSARQQKLSEAFFEAMTSGSAAYAASFSTRAIVACP